MCPAVRQQCFTMLSLRARHANSSVVGCKNEHQCLYSVPATQQQKRQWLRFIFEDNVPAVVHVMRVSTKLCLDTDPHKRISPNHTGPSNCTRATEKCCCGLIVFIVAYKSGEVSWKLAN